MLATHWLIADDRVTELAVSPDGQWIASTGGRGTLRLWPMPDLDRPPLQSLPLDDLLELLRAQTNLRVRPAGPDDWSVYASTTGYFFHYEDPAFKSWDDVPTW